MLTAALTTLLAASLAGLGWAAQRRIALPAAGGDGIDAVSPWRRPAGAGFRVTTYNIHAGVGLDRRRDLQRIAAALRDSDIAGLQEVAPPGVFGSPDQAEVLGRLLDCGWLFLPQRERWFRPHRGNALLSRFACERWYREPLVDTSGRRQRNLGRASVSLGVHGTVEVFVTHASRNGDREAQIETALARFAACPRAVLLGDLNAGREHPLLAAALGEGIARDALAELLGSQDPAERIDWILVRGLEVRGAGMLPAGASDHPCYWADLALPREAVD